MKLVLSQSILAGIRVKKRAAMSQRYGSAKILLQNIFIMKDKCRLLIKVCLAAIWAFALFCSVYYYYYYALNKILNSDWLNTNLTLVDV